VFNIVLVPLAVGELPIDSIPTVVAVVLAALVRPVLQPGVLECRPFYYGSDRDGACAGQGVPESAATHRQLISCNQQHAYSGSVLACCG